MRMKLPKMRDLFSPDLSCLSDTLRNALPFSANLEQCEPLAGDASNRRYYRLFLSEAPVGSIILMQLAEAEGFKASEEAVSGAESDIVELPFINILRHLKARGAFVPSLYFYDEAGGLLYLEDFGDETLARACQGASMEVVEHWYGQAIDQLVHLHGRATHPTATCLAFTRSFDVALFLWEFEHFLEYGLTARHGCPLRHEDEGPIREVFQKIAEWLASQPKVFTHRDFHSRNLMVHGQRLGLIDFQDALLGPVTYDLASLLRDSYIALDEGMIDRLIGRYIQGLRSELPISQHHDFLLDDPETFRRLFDFTSVQRNLKAAGRFVYIDKVKHNPNFLPSIPHTLRNVRSNFEKYPEFHDLQTRLTPYIPEWQ